MKVIYNEVLPFKGFKAITLYPFGVFVRVKDKKNIRPWEIISDTTVNHESIHLEQQKEMLVILFYLWYLLAWVIRKLVPNNGDDYRNSYFEQEAYEHAENFEYLKTRKRFAWVKYIFDVNPKNKS